MKSKSLSVAKRRPKDGVGFPPVTTLYIIGDLVDRWSSSMMTVVGAVVPGLLEKLGDNKIVIRQTAMKIFYKIFNAVVGSFDASIPPSRC